MIFYLFSRLQTTVTEIGIRSASEELSNNYFLEGIILYFYIYFFHYQQISVVVGAVFFLQRFSFYNTYILALFFLKWYTGY